MCGSCDDGKKRKKKRKEIREREKEMLFSRYSEGEGEGVKDINGILKNMLLALYVTLKMKVRTFKVQGGCSFNKHDTQHDT